MKLIRATSGFTDWDAVHVLIAESFAYMTVRLGHPPKATQLSAAQLASEADAETAFLLLDVAPAAGQPALGFLSNLALTPRLFVFPAGSTNSQGPAAGSASVTLPWTLAPPSAGFTVFAQWLIVDAGSPGGIFAASQGVRLPVF